jgi:hypothetical protein
MDSEHYQEFINPDADKLTVKQQYAQAWHNIRATKRRKEYSIKLQTSFYYALCAEFGVSYKVAKTVRHHWHVTDWTVYPTYWQKMRAARLQQLEQPQACDIQAMAYHF